jgi:hypothetical protein
MSLGKEFNLIDQSQDGPGGFGEHCDLLYLMKNALFAILKNPPAGDGNSCPKWG